MDIKPEPNEENGTVDLVYNLESKANDQIEFSAGWGQTGVIGKLSLKFTISPSRICSTLNRLKVSFRRATGKRLRSVRKRMHVIISSIVFRFMIRGSEENVRTRSSSRLIIAVRPVSKVLF